MNSCWHRIEAPAFRAEQSIESDRATYGGQFEWYWAVPAVYRAVIDPDGCAVIPARPHDRSSHATALGYWSALHNLLVFRLGWAVPHRGLCSWYDAGKPTDDPTLSFIRRVWDADGTLDIYLAWLLLTPMRFRVADMAASALRLPADGVQPRWRAWASDQVGRSRTMPHFDLSGGWDPLHLSGHGLAGDPTDDRAEVTDPARRRAVLVTERADGWASTLARAGSALPDIGANSWHVDVHVMSIGHLGTFRRSRDTGLWFTGKHSVHLAGNTSTT